MLLRWLRRSATPWEANAFCVFLEEQVKSSQRDRLVLAPGATEVGAGHPRIDRSMKLMELVNEVYGRLLSECKITWNDWLHSYLLAANMMRNIPVELAQLGMANLGGGMVASLFFDTRMDGLGRKHAQRKLDLNSERPFIAGG